MADDQWIKSKWKEKLQSACEDGDFETVLKVIGEGCSPRRSLTDGLQPLHYAAAHGQLDVVRTLVDKHNCDVACRDREGHTPLHCAAAYGELDAVRLLVEHHCNVASKDKMHCTSLHYACYYGHSDVVKYLVNEQKCDPFAKNINSESPLHYAIGKIKCGIPPPLQYECTCSPGHFTIVKFFLVECNYTPEQFGANKLTHVLKLAVMYGTLEDVKNLIEKKKLVEDFQECTIEACMAGKLDILKYFLAERNHQLNIQDYVSLLQKLLMMACQYEKVRVVQYLTKVKQFSPSLTSKPLYNARESLSKSGEKQAVSDCHRQKLRAKLQSACEDGDFETVLKVIGEGCSPRRLLRDGLQPLHYATAHGRLDVVRTLVDKHDCDVACRDKMRCTSLHYACYYGHSDVVKYLVNEQKCSPFSRNRNNESPLHYAIEKHRECMVNEQVCIAFAKNNDSVSPLRYGSVVAHPVEHLHRRHSKHKHNHHMLPPLHQVDPKYNIGHFTIVKFFLVECNYTPKQFGITKEMTHALQLACVYSTLEDVKILIERKELAFDFEDCVANTCMAGRLDILKYFLEGANFQLEKHQLKRLARHKMVTPDIFSTPSPTTVREVICLQPLHCAAAYGQLDVLRTLVLVDEHRCDVTCRDREGYTPLHYAAAYGQLDAVRILVEHHCDIACKDKMHCTPLHYACYYGHSGIVKYLVNEQKCDPFTKNINSESPLHYAIGKIKCSIPPPLQYECTCSTGHFTIVKFFLVECNYTPEQFGANDLTHVLKLAVMYGTLEDVKILIEKILIEDLEEWMIEACTAGKLDILKYFLEERDCQLEKQEYNSLLHRLFLATQDCFVEHVLQYLLNEKQYSPNLTSELLYYACDFSCKSNEEQAVSDSHVQVARYLVVNHHCDPMEHVDIVSPLELSCQKGRVELVEALLIGRDVNCQDKYGNTPLHMACKHEQVDIVRLLTLEKCSQSIQNSNGELPLHIACSKGSCEIVQLVSDCNVNTTNEDGDTPLHIACKYYKQVEIVRLLTLEKCCSQSIQNSNGELPLHIACSKGSCEIVQLVSDCNVNTVNRDGDTPLHIACKYEQVDIVRLLTLEKCCSQSIQNRYGELPLHFACSKGSHEIIELVSSCNVNTVNNNGDTPLHIACRKNVVVACRKNVLVTCREDSVDVIQFLAETPPYLNCSRLSSDQVIDVLQFLTRKKHCKQDIQNENGELPLHIACRKGSIDVVKLVCDCDVNAQTIDGNTPLHVACMHECVDAVVQKPDCEFTCNSIPLQLVQGPDDLYNIQLEIACRECVVFEIVYFLTKQKHCDLNIQNEQGELPLHLACKLGSASVVKLVSDCDVNAQTTDGNTPLHVACKQEHDDVVSHWQMTTFELLFYECEPLDIILQIAFSECVLELVHFLTQEIHCKKNILNKKGELPLHIARRKGSTDVEKLVSDCDVNAQTIDRSPQPHVTCTDVYMVQSYCRCDPMKHTDRWQQHSPFELACQKGSVELVEALLTGRDVNCKDEYGNTPLHLACEYEQVDIVRLLTLEKCCSQSIQNGYGELPLHIACSKGSLEIVELVSSCNVNTVNNNGDTPLHIACRKNVVVACRKNVLVTCREDSVDVIQFLAETPPYQNCSRLSSDQVIDVLQFLTRKKHCKQDIQNENGELPLHIACRKGSIDVVKLISDCNVNAQTIDGNTPLHVACMHESVNVTIQRFYTPYDILLQKVQIPDSFDIQLQTACRECVVFDIVQFLTKEKDGDLNIHNKERELPLHLACKLGSAGVVKLVSDCDVNAQTIDGDTPLHVACRHKCDSIVSYMTEEKLCDCNVQNKDGELPLHIACRLKCLKLVKLVDNCNIHTKTVSGKTPIHTAYECNDAPHREPETVHDSFEQVFAILKHFVHVRWSVPVQSDLYQDLPYLVHVACEMHDLEVVKALATPENVNSQRYNGDTPLHVACRNTQTEIVRFLVNEVQYEQSLHWDMKIAKQLPGMTDYPVESGIIDFTTANDCGELPIHVACGQPCLEIVKLVNKCDVNLRDRDGNTQLHIACQNGTVDIVKYLHEKNCDPTIANKRGELPLHLASKHSLEIVKLVSKCDVNAISQDGMSPLHIACLHAKLKIVKYLIEEKHADPENSLYYACNCLSDTSIDIRNNNVQVVRYLMTKVPCNPLAWKRLNFRFVSSPMEFACQEGHLEFAKALTTINTVNCVSTTGDTSLHLACKYEQLLIVKFLVEVQQCNQNLKNHNKELPLHIACRFDSLAIVKLVSNCDVNIQTANGDTALHLACKYGAPEIVSYLLQEKECNPSIQNSEGELPLHIASCKSLDIVKIFSNCNDINTQTYDGNTVLHFACRHGDPEIVLYLLEKKCNPSIQNSKGELPIHIASCKSLDIVELVSDCSDINTQANNGDTSLHFACRANTPEVVSFLIQEKQCDPTIANNKQELPLHLACAHGLLEIVKLVSECDVDAKTATGRTALHIALEEHNYNIINYLIHEKHADTTALIRVVCRMGVRAVKVLSTLESVDFTDENGNTPLHIACMEKRLDIVRYLAQEELCISNIQNNDGQLPLHICFQQTEDLKNISRTGNFTKKYRRRMRKIRMEMVRLVSNCNGDTQCINGDTPLHLACKCGHTRIVKYLVEVRRLTQQLKNHNGELPLHLACGHSLELVKLVSNCNPDTQQEDGNTPLHIACRHNKGDIVRFLISHLKCNQNLQNKKKELALHIACQNCNIKISRMFDTRCVPDGQQADGETPLHIACRNKQGNIVAFLIRTLKCASNILNQKGELPLHIACQVCSLKCVKMVSCGCNPDTQREDGDTPLHIACRLKQVDIIRYLTQTKNCASNIQNLKGELPLHIACKSFSMKSVVLVRRNCNLDTQEENGDTPLHIACSNGNLKLIYYLSKEGSSANVPNNHGQLPLHILLDSCSALKTSDMEVLCPCNVNAVTAKGDTLLHIACRNPFMEESVLGYLTETKECDLNIQNNKGELPLHIVLAHGFVPLKVVKMLSKCDVNKQTESGDTPVHITCNEWGCYSARSFQISCKVLGWENVEGIKYLVDERQCDITIVNKNHELPLHRACRIHSLAVVKLLINQSVSLNAQTVEGNTPLHEACHNERYADQIVEYLIGLKDCNPSIANGKGELPLHIACQRESFEMVKMLHKSDVHKKTILGNTPLHEVCICKTREVSTTAKIVKYLIQERGCNANCKNNEEKTPLHYACEVNDSETAEILLLEGNANPSVVDCKGQTPLMVATHSELIKLLLDHGADPKPLYEVYQEFFEDSSSSPPPTPLKVLVVGNAATGKTTLVESLQKEGGQQTPTQLDESKLHTAGIIPTNFRSDTYGPVTLYDFAGQHEYYASHGAMMETIVRHSSPAILLLVNISENVDCMERKLFYWLAQLENQLVSATAKPHLMIVGSHADECEGTDLQEKILAISKSLRKRLQKSPLKHVTSVSMDCRQPNSLGIITLQKHLKQSSNELRDAAVMNFSSHCFYVFLLDHFHNREAVTVEMVSTAISSNSPWPNSDYYEQPVTTTLPTAFLPSSIEDVTRVCKELGKKGHVLFLENLNTPPMSWMILKKRILLSKINGTVFAPKGFRQNRGLASSTGVVPFSKIAAHIPWYDPNMIVEYFLYKEFCQKIDDQKLKLLINANAPKPSHPLYQSERFYFFPALVNIKTPQIVWRKDKQFVHQSGWILECSKSDHFLTPRFLQVLILRLAFSFALTPSRPVRNDDDMPVIKRVCSVWKSGIAWKNRHGVETLVEVREQNQTLVVMIRCMKQLTSVLECVQLRSAVIQKVLEAKKEFCPHVFTVESFIAPIDLQYPPNLSIEMTLYTMASVAATVAEGAFCVLTDEGDSIGLEELLAFEPYADLRKDIIKELFDDRKQEEEVKDSFLYAISESVVEKAESVQQKKDFFTKMFNPSRTLLQERINRAPGGDVNELARIFQFGRGSKGTYHCLREKLDKFSIFCGRNPLDLQTTSSVY